MTPPPLNLVLDTTKPFALLEKNGIVGAYQGRIFELDRLIDIHTVSKSQNRDIVFVLPYRSIQEKGCAATGDEPILAMTIEKSFTLPRNEFSSLLPEDQVVLEGDIRSSLSDDDFAAMVRQFQQEAIEKGLCSQTTLSRIFSGKIFDLSLPKILGLYRHLLGQTGHYMTVLFANIDPDDDWKSNFILAGTPERHLEISGNETIMCPIAGTCRKEDPDTFPGRLESFLEDPKEINELFQVLDEEMKMMGTICPRGGTIHGPYLREIGAVVHSEYMLIGRRSTHAIDALRATLHAPTVVGSPLMSAARLIAKYEPQSRRYYGGEIGLYRQPRTDVPDGDIDCAILIRGAEIFGDGTFHIQAGAGIVRDSNAESEASETRAKALGLLRVMTGDTSNTIFLTAPLRRDLDPLLKSRNAALSRFWKSDQGTDSTDILSQIALRDKSVTIINNEDDFAFMLGHMIRTMGVKNIDIIDTFAFDSATSQSDLVLLGPGPGDPADMRNPRMQRLQDMIAILKASGKPLLGICLGHQALAVSAGLAVLQQHSATQGMPRHVRIDGEDCLLGFYNSFSPVETDKNIPFSVDLDEQGRIIALRGEKMVGYQFHPESVMSVDGQKLLRRALIQLLPMDLQ